MKRFYPILRPYGSVTKPLYHNSRPRMTTYAFYDETGNFIQRADCDTADQAKRLADALEASSFGPTSS